MTIIAGPSLDLFARMFPGLPERRIPGFVEAGAVAALSATSRDLAEWNTLLSDNPGAVQSPDVNEALSLLRALAPDLVREIVEQATAAYFGCPAVAVALTGVPSPLFPSNRIMGEIDFDLLEPVVTHRRGVPE